MKSPRLAIPILLLVLGSFAIVPFLSLTASANYPDGFDTYASGTTNPFLWRTTVTNSTCIPSVQVSSVRGFLSAPNSLTYTLVPGPSGAVCVGTVALANTTLPFNASTVYSSVKAFFKVSNNNTDIAASTIQAFTCITTQPHPCTSGFGTGASNSAYFSNCTPVTSGFCFLTTSFATSPGSKYYFTFEIYFAATWSQTNSICNAGGCFALLDNTSITGGNVLLPNPNFFMVNTSSLQWFSIASYAGSSIVLNKTGGAVNNSAQWAPNGVLEPDINYSGLSTANLITVYVGNIYSRTLIPSAGLKTTMYLDNPSFVVSFTIAVTGPPDAYGPKSKIFIAQAGHNVTSGYLDSSAKFSPYLIPGTYVVTVISQNGANTQVQTINFPATSTTITFNAYAAFTINNAAGVISAIGWQTGWNGTSAPRGIVIAYTDNLSSTCGSNNIGVEIKRTNGTGSFLVFSQFYTASGCGVAGGQFFTTTIPAANNNYNWTLSNQLTVFLNATNFFGTHYSLGSQGLACFGCLLLTSPNIPTDTLGLGNLLPNLTWLNIISFAMVAMTAGGFGVYWSRFGFFAVGLEVSFFAAAGWLVLSSSSTIAASISIVFIVLSFIGLMIFHERT